MAAGLDFNEELCGDLGVVDILDGDLGLGGDGSLGVSEEGSSGQGVALLGLGPGVDDAGPHNATTGVVPMATLVLDHTLPLLVSGHCPH